MPALISIALIILDFYYLTTNPLKAAVSLSFFFGVVLKFYILFLLILNFLLVKKFKTIPFQNRKMLWLIWIGIILCFVIAKNWHTFEETCYQDHLHMRRIDTNVRTAERAVESLLSFTASDHVFQETIEQIISDLGSMDNDIMRWGSSFTMANTSIPPNIAVKLSSLYEDEVLQAEDIKFLEQLKQALHTLYSQTVDCDYQSGITIFHRNSQCTTPFIQHYREFLNDLSTLQ